MSDNTILSNKGVFLLQGEINEELIRSASEFILAHCVKPVKGIHSLQFIVNSPGGCIELSKQIIDLMRFSSVPVETTVVGEASSAGSLISCAGSYRTCSDTATYMTHEYSWGVEGKHHELISATKGMDIMYNYMVNHYVNNTKLNKTQVKKYLLTRGDVYLTAKKAKEYGLVDDIVKSYK